jgi:beta-1,4-mannosyltransferase
VRVMQSFPALLPTTNPYLKQLFASVNEIMPVSLFSWNDAILGRFDVLHVHWPELLLRGRSRPRSALRQIMVLLILLRVRTTRKALVRTVHNVEPHEPGSTAERLLLRLFDRWTTLFVLLIPGDVPRTGAPSVLIPHGDYRAWFQEISVPDSKRGRFAYVGLIRAYKGVEQLVEAFAKLPDPDARLRIVGKVHDPLIGAHITRASKADTRMTADLRYVSDEEMAREIGEAELIVLPYRAMHNSGTALLALSLRRPILVPATAVTDELAGEVGPNWVLRYHGELGADTLHTARAAVSTLGQLPPPVLEKRAWPNVAGAHVAAYERALSLRRSTQQR